MQSLEVVNLAEARFECTFGRGCDGICCREGRPPLSPAEIACIDAELPRILEHLRPAARSAIERKGYRTRPAAGEPRVRNADGWCVFFNGGCLLHKLGADEGDKYKYKPFYCAVFPLQDDAHGRWFVRQKGFNGEKWDLFCLDPANQTKPAAKSLQEELTVAARSQPDEVAANGHTTCQGSSR
jgi:hypothetical protein